MRIFFIALLQISKCICCQFIASIFASNIYNRVLYTKITKHMQNSAQKNHKFTSEMRELLTKIGKLRKKLISYGYSTDQVISIILEEFLKLPKIDWENLNSTPIFYDLKDHFRTDTSTTQMIMCLQKIVPNLHAPEVCQYLLRVLEFNSLAFGFNLIDSSSDSNQSNSVLHRRIMHRSKRRLKNPNKKDRQQKNAGYHAQLQAYRPKKKIHKTPNNQQDSKQMKESDVFFGNFFEKKPDTLFHQLKQFDPQLQKQMKRVNTDENQRQDDQDQQQISRQLSETIHRKLPKQ